MLMKSRSMGGNFVLNFGPDGNGNFHPEEDKIRIQIGDWMKTNSEAVYGTRHADVPLSNYGYFTQKDDTLYLTVFNRPVNNVLRLAMEKKAKKIPGSASLLQNGKELELKHSNIALDLDKNTYFDVILPKDFESEQPFVVKIELKKGTAAGEKLMDAKM